VAPAPPPVPPPPAPGAPPIPLVPMPPAPAEPEIDSNALAAPIAPTTWQRIALAPGIELHVAAPADARQNHIVARLIRAAGRILAEPPEKEGE
jgi:hypothetical protein